MIVRYSNNNSGGAWWLTTEDYERLEQAGWNVHWVQPSKFGGFENPVSGYTEPLKPLVRTGGKYMGCEACSAAKRFDSVEEAVAEWESLTHQTADDEGCTTCGPPHNFEEVNEKKENENE